MRVLMVDPNSETPYYDRSLCRALLSLGCDVELLTSHFAYDDMPATAHCPVSNRFYNAVHWPPVRRTPVYTARWLRRLVKALEHSVDLVRFLRYCRCSSADIVHFQWAGIPPLDYLAFRQVSRMGLPVVYTVHNVLPNEPRPWHGALYAPLYRTADALIAHSAWAKRELGSRFDIPERRVRIVPCGNLELFTTRLLGRTQAKAELGIPADRRVVLFFGIIRPYKGLNVLLEAFPQIARSVPGAMLVVTGRPAEPFGPYQRTIDRLGISQNTRLDLRFVAQDEAAVYFAAADVVVLPYTRTTTSHVVLMAYTFARPVVATMTGGLPEVVEDGKTGRLVPPGDRGAIARAVSELLADDGASRAMGLAGRHLARTRYSWHAIATATLSVYDDCLASGALGLRSATAGT